MACTECTNSFKCLGCFWIDGMTGPESPEKENDGLMEFPEGKENSSGMLTTSNSLPNENVDTLNVTSVDKEINLSCSTNVIKSATNESFDISSKAPETVLLNASNLETPFNEKGILCLLLDDRTPNITVSKTYKTTGTQYPKDNPVGSDEYRKGECVTIGTQYDLKDFNLEKPEDDLSTIQKEICVSSKNALNLHEDHECVNPTLQKQNLVVGGLSVCSDENSVRQGEQESIVPESDFDNGFSTDASGSCKDKTEPIILQISGTAERSPLAYNKGKIPRKEDASIEIESQEVEGRVHSKSDEVKLNPVFSSIMCQRWSSPESLDEEDIIEARQGNPVKRTDRKQKQQREQKKRKCNSGNKSESSYVPNTEKQNRKNEVQARVPFSSIMCQRWSSPENLSDEDCDDNSASKGRAPVQKDNGNSSSKRVTFSDPVSFSQSSTVNVPKNAEKNADDNVHMANASDSLTELPVERNSSVFDSPMFDSIPSPPVFFKYQPIRKLKCNNFFFDDMSSQESHTPKAVSVEKVFETPQQTRRNTTHMSAHFKESMLEWSDVEMEDASLSVEGLPASKRKQLVPPEKAAVPECSVSAADAALSHCGSTPSMQQHHHQTDTSLLLRIVSYSDSSEGEDVSRAQSSQKRSESSNAPSCRGDLSANKRNQLVPLEKATLAEGSVSAADAALSHCDSTPSKQNHQHRHRHHHHHHHHRPQQTDTRLPHRSVPSSDSSEAESAKQGTSEVSSTSKKSAQKTRRVSQGSKSPTGSSIWMSDDEEEVPVRKLPVPPFRQRLELLGKPVLPKSKIQDIWDSDDDAESVNSSRRSKLSANSPMMYRGKRREYTEEDRVKILNFIVEEHLIRQIGGVAMWRMMEKQNVCNGRTWQSMKEHFRKQILPRIDTYELPRKVKAAFKSMRS